MMVTRQLGRSGIDVSAMGLGCWAIGGPIWRDGEPRGWGDGVLANLRRNG